MHGWCIMQSCSLHGWWIVQSCSLHSGLPNKKWARKCSYHNYLSMSSISVANYKTNLVLWLAICSVFIFIFFVLWICPPMGLFCSICTGWLRNTLSFLLELIFCQYIFFVYFWCRGSFFPLLHQLSWVDSIQTDCICFIFL